MIAVVLNDSDRLCNWPAATFAQLPPSTFPVARIARRHRQRPPPRAQAQARARVVLAARARIQAGQWLLPMMNMKDEPSSVITDGWYVIAPPSPRDLRR